MSSSPERIAVIGTGNILRRDDGIGIAVLGSLLAFHKRPGIDYRDFGTASFDLLNHMRSYDKMLVIDGIDASLKPGELKIAELGELACSLKGGTTSTHGLDLKVVVELYKKLKIKTKIYVAGIQVEDISYGEGLSKPLEAKIGKIAKEIDLFIGRMAGA
jgi:hydrogenase maturation protease